MFPQPTPTVKTYTVYLSPTVSIQVKSATAPTVGNDKILWLDGAPFQDWSGCIETAAVPAPAPAAPSSGGILGWLTGK